MSDTVEILYILATLAFLYYVVRQLVLRVNGRKWLAVSQDAEKFVGKLGITQSMLRPGGIAVVEGQRIHVMTDGSAIDAGSPIEVVAVAGGRITVKCAG